MAYQSRNNRSVRLVLRVTVARRRSSPGLLNFFSESGGCCDVGSCVGDSGSRYLSAAQGKRISMHETRMQLQFLREVKGDKRHE
jgi:hypothetical protein